MILAGAVLINLFADLYLVKDLGLGVKGAAIATVFSQLLSVAGSVLYMLWKNRKLCFKREDLGISVRLLKHSQSFQ